MNVKRRQLEAGSVVDRSNRERNKIMKHGTKRRGLEPALERGDSEQSAGYVLQHLDGVHALEPKSNDAVHFVQGAGRQSAQNDSVERTRFSGSTACIQIRNYCSPSDFFNKLFEP